MANSSKFRRGITVAIIAILLLLVVGRGFFFDYYTIPQNGMYPSLPAGSRLFTRKHPYANVDDVQRGDIIVFVRQKAGQPYVYIWRVVGLPGEKVEAVGESLVINGVPTQRERLREDEERVIYREQIGDASYEIAIDKQPKDVPANVSASIPADHFFVMGDNRFAAADSRSFGTVPFSAIIGRKF